MNNIAKALAIPAGIGLYIQSFFISGHKISPHSVSGLVPEIGTKIFLTPTNTPTPTLTPSPTPTPKPTATPSPTPSSSPSPTPTAIPITGNDLDNWFSRYSSEYQIDRDKLLKIAVCESNLHADSVNGIYTGMYQFSPSAWKNTRSQMGLDPNPDLRINPEEAIKTAAFKISVSGSGAWPNCGK